VAKPKSIGFRLRGVAGIVAITPIVVIVLISKRWAPIDKGTWVGLSLDVAGWICFLLGCFLRLSSIVFVGGRKGKGVVSTGPYSMCRNPLYLGSLLIAVSGALLLHCLSGAAAIALASVFYLMIVIPSEERQLHEAFKEDWEKYVAGTPRLIPKFRWIAGEQWHEVDLRALRNESLRVLGMALMPLIVMVIWQLREKAAWWPRWDVVIW
jgi:protein-S-isoprenylcysteine O-methyltransferase Ste14